MLRFCLLVARLGIAVACVGLSACTQRSVGISDDGGRNNGRCDPPCEEPYRCNASTGDCDCPVQCCAMVDCFCSEDERHCDGEDLTGCESVEVWGEDGLCGSICENPPVQHCEQGCVEDTWGRARCEEEQDYCNVQSGGGFRVSVVMPDAQAYDCDRVRMGEPRLSVDVDGHVLDFSENSFTLQTADGTAVINHNLSWSASRCFWMLDQIRLQAEWTSDSGWYCIQRISIYGSDDLLVYAIDGEVRGAGDTFSVGLYDLDCDFPPDGWCAPPARFALDFTFDGGGQMRVYQGECDKIGYGWGWMNVCNLRSFESGWCDDYWNYSFFVAQDCLATTNLHSDPGAD